jgi:hypothetical protein
VLVDQDGQPFAAKIGAGMGEPEPFMSLYVPDEYEQN